ncbi:MAG: TMEM165/GDT1 family protein [Chloroflexi bacterium]|nr:TMEM165/GDT1 family protein [Chloroflexota bacterium]
MLLGTFGESLATAGSSFGLITLAEIGDKSQLVCMTMAARHRALPVLLGAIVAFSLLNLLAVLFGAVASNWLPDTAVYVIVAVLFTIFGIHSWRIKPDSNTDNIAEKSARSVWIAAFLLVFVSEFGDKTQIAVAGMSSAAQPIPVWIGATLALAVTSTLGVLAGRTLLQRISITILHRISAIVFLGLAVYAITRIFN